MTSATPTRDFDHVILTRFSVRFPESPPIDEDWLAYRWAFFRDALASSLTRQTSRTFQWLVFFDIDTPTWLREEIDELSPGLFTPVYVSSWAPQIAQSAVAEVSTAPYLITTRIDSDDAVARQFVADVQSHFDDQESLYINLLSGVQVERSGEVYRYDEPSNPFISYIEKRVKTALPRTVFQNLSHGRSREFGDLLNVVGPPRWMQIIHGSNIANGVRGLRVRPEAFEADFVMDLPFDRTVSQRRYLRERTRSLFDLLGFWLRRPTYAREFLIAQRLKSAGTQTLTAIRR
ncbi:glycosyltransferase [Microbacterium saperdae]